MSLPTAHNYVIKNLMESLLSLEESFLEPKILIGKPDQNRKSVNDNIDAIMQK